MGFKQTFLSSSKRIWRGATLTTFGSLLTIVLSVFWDIGAPLEIFIRLLMIVSFISLIIGIIQIVYALLFEQNKSLEKQNEALQLESTARHLQLANTLVQDFDSLKAERTEKSAPPSITERTTKLLKNE